MSITTWKKEFYSRPKKSMTDKECAEHTMNKYIGTLKENIVKHNLTRDRNSLYSDKDMFFFNGDTCSFCIKYYKEEDDKGDCGDCPIRLESNKTCFHSESHYYKFIDNSSKPMINLMKKIIDKCNTEGVYEKRKTRK